MFRQRPLLAVRRLRAYQLMEELSARETFGFLLDRRRYGQWLADTLAATTERGGLAKPRLVMAWDNTLVWPKWLASGQLVMAALDRGFLAGNALIGLAMVESFAIM